MNPEKDRENIETREFREKTEVQQAEARIDNIQTLLDTSKEVDLKHLLEEMEPEDVAEILSEFNVDDKIKLFNFLDADNAAVVLDDTDSQTRLQILQKVDNEQLARILDQMPVDEAADLVEDAPVEDREEILDLMEAGDAEDVEEILSYPEDSAARVMNPRFVSVGEKNTVEDAVLHIRSLELDEDVFYVYVTGESGELKGLVSVRNLLTAQPGTIIANIMEDEVHSIAADADQEEAARIIKKYDVFSLPVLDAGGCIIGRITVDDIMDVVDEEHAEDISRMTGTIEEEEGTESTFQAAQNRLPWLITCMFGSLVTGIVIQSFEATLTETIALVTFIPVITATGGNSGVQASTVVVREFALGHFKYFKVIDEVWRQIKIALGVGTICGVTLSIVAHFWKKNTSVGLIVGLAIFLVVVWSNIVGVIAPVLFRRVRIDPAIAAGPLITTLNDIVGVLIYLSIASVFLK